MRKRPLAETPPDEIAAAIRKADGNLAAVARKYGVTRQAVRGFVLRHEELKLAAHDSRECLKDEAESALIRAMRDRESWAVCFFLKTQAKDRGYTERADVGVEITRPTVLAIEEVEAAGGEPQCVPEE